MAGVQKMISVVDDDFLEIQEKTRDKNVELTREAYEFVVNTFRRYDTDCDGALQTSELEKIFSRAPESTWIKALCKEAAELGGISILRILSEWALITVRDPVSSVMNLLCIGYRGEPSSAIRVTQRGCIQSERKVFQCFVFGPEQAGKSALLSTLNEWPFSDNYIPTKEDRYAVNTFDIRGKWKILAMREIPEVAAKQLLSNKDALAACDIAVFVYDSSSKSSWKRTRKLLRKVETHGYKGPFLIVSTKDDLDSHKKSLQDSIIVSKEMGIDEPISISSKMGDFKDLFQKIILAAEHPHMSIPETVDGKSHKQDHQLADFPLPFKLEALKVDREERKKSVWMTLSTVEEELSAKSQNVGGALCIDPSGILITSRIATCPLNPIVSDPSRFNVWALKGGEVRVATLEKEFIEYGVMLYRIRKKYPSEQFDFVDLDSVGDIELEEGTELYGFIHDKGPGYDFSFRRGYISYPIPPNDVPFWNSKTIDSMTPNEHKKRKKSTRGAYRTVYGVVMDPHLEQCYPIEASQMFSDVPLLQVSELGWNTYTGQSGCPIFKCEGDGLLGLVLFHINCFSFVLPVNVLLRCYAQFKKKAGEKKRKRKDDI